MWNEHRTDLVDLLKLNETEFQRWAEAPNDADAAAALGAEMITGFINSMARHCFVIMPFQESHTALYDFVIEPAVKALGDTPVRTDRMGIPGDVGRQIDEGIQRAEYVIVVLDELRPNVLYELGLVHGRSTPTILLNKRDRLDSNTPFDLTMHQRLEYDEIDGTLPKKLQDAIRALGHF